MKSIKKLARYFVGRKNAASIVIDAFKRTPSGYCIVGWYLTDAVVSLSVNDNNGIEQKTTLTTHERPDAEAATRKTVSGFQLLVETLLDSDSIKLCVAMKNGEKALYDLSLTSEDVLVPAVDDAEHIASTTDSTIKGACEYLIYSDTHLFVGGWIMAEGQPTSISVKVGKEEVISGKFDVLRFHRDDVVNAFGASSATRNTGYMILFDRTSTLKPVDFSKANCQITFAYAHEKASMPINEKYDAASDRMVNAKRLLNQWLPHSPQHLKKHAIYTPMLQAIFKQAKAPSVQRFDFNTALLMPPLRASIVIPLYGRYDFMRYQLSYFARMGTYKDCEVLYVVDDPKIAPHALKLAKEMAIITQQPFSLLQLSENVGFGRANNIGASKASAENLVLLNSDVLPKTPDWLDRMLETLGDDNTGIVGARLLFEDESLQHDGMAPMRVADYPGLLFNDHPRKGWPAELSPVTDAVVTCPLLTAACWAIKKADYDAMGGFDPAYILGDFEDSDLCLRLIEAGKTNYLRRDAVLYHLERQSQNLVEAGRWKHNITILNAIHFNQKWKTQLETLETQGATGV